MASEITNMLPFRQYSDNDVVNMFALEDASTSIGAGTVVKVKNTTNGLNADFAHGQNGENYLNVQGNAYSPEIVNPLKVLKAGDGDVALGITLRDVRETDENGEKLRFYPQKKEELQCVVSGETIPVATKGIFTLMASAFSGSVVPAPLAELKVSAGGTLAINGNGSVVGQILATGKREGSADTHAGGYAIAKLNF